MTTAVYRLKLSSVVAISMWGVMLVAIIASFVISNPTPDAWLMLGVMLAFSGLQIAYLASQRAEFTLDSFVYRKWGHQISVRYRDVMDIEWIIAPRSYFSAAIDTVDGRRYTLPLKLFPHEVAGRLAEILLSNRRN